MGIERFFTTVKRSPIITYNGIADPVETYEDGHVKKYSTTHLYIDFNSITYGVAADVIADMNELIRIRIFEYSDNYITKLVRGEHVHISNLQTKYGVYYDQQFSDIFKEEPAKIKEILKPQINRIIEEKIIIGTVDMIRSYFDNGMLKHIFIAADGIPSYSKIMEQIKRRYMKRVIGEVEKGIYKSFKNSLSKERQEYENDKFWGAPSVDLKEIVNKLISLKSYLIEAGFSKDIQIIVSPENDYGEGEMKIVNKIKEDRLNKTIDGSSIISIFSPDADTIILSMILYSWFIDLEDTSIVPIYILNKSYQQKENKMFIYKTDINAFCRNIYRYVVQDTIQPYPRIPDIRYVINDIAFIFTFFGNDFLPKFTTLDIGDCFNEVISIYKTVICQKIKIAYTHDTSIEYLVFKTDKYNLNIEFLTELTDFFISLEKQYIDLYQIKQKYVQRGIEFIANKVNEDTRETPENIVKNIIINLTKFYDKLEELNRQISSFNTQGQLGRFKNSSKRMYSLIFDEGKTYNEAHEIVTRESLKFFADNKIPYEKDDTNLIHSIVLKWWNAPQFINNLRDICYKNIGPKSKSDLDKYLSVTATDYYGNIVTASYTGNLDHLGFLVMYIGLFIITGFNQNSFPKINFEDYNKNYTIDQYPHNENFKKRMEQYKLEPTNYDKELFKLNNLLDEYREILNHKVINLCKYELGKKEKQQYTTFMRCENDKQASIDYYIKNFQNKSLEKQSVEERKKHICTEYFVGLVWVFEYYFNHGLKNMTSTWYYPYHFSPLMTDFAQINRDNGETKLLNALNLVELSYVHDMKSYLTREEHTVLLNHISGFNKVTDQSIKIKYIIGRVTETKILPIGELDPVVNAIIARSKQNDQIDCTNAMYLTKCFLHKIMDRIPSYQTYVSTIR